ARAQLAVAARADLEDRALHRVEGGVAAGDVVLQLVVGGRLEQPAQAGVEAGPVPWLVNQADAGIDARIVIGRMVDGAGFRIDGAYVAAGRNGLRTDDERSPVAELPAIDGERFEELCAVVDAARQAVREAAEVAVVAAFGAVLRVIES